MTDRGQASTALPGRLHEAVTFLLWADTPFHRMDASGLYDLLSTRALTEQGLYLNLG